MPRYGFNFQWMFTSLPGRAAEGPDPRALDFLAEFGFDFVRIPTDYRFWTHDFDYFHPAEHVWELIDAYLEACRSRGLHMCLNLHRAPGYCINNNDLERHNLWLDLLPQDAFVFTWEQFARRYQGIPSAELSFDLVNEPPDIGQYGLTRENHAALVRRTTAAIRAIDPQREIVIDGLGGGNIAMPELADAGVVHSGRGYQPMNISHFEAPWWSDWQGQPYPVYPGTQFMGRTWNRATLREFYQPWRDVQALGAPVHIGEFGCFNHTPNDVALRWFADLLSVFHEFGWGYSLWGFEDAFGIAGHDRPGVRYEDLRGYRVDRALLDLLLSNRVTG
ncbi:MAG TPA: cellulase family glycosylhydrolase [Anaerolinea sp.]|nr:cellulase family glycosylhydrolase [Anaerolinea sp.]